MKCGHDPDWVMHDGEFAGSCGLCVLLAALDRQRIENDRLKEVATEQKIKFKYTDSEYSGYGEFVRFSEDYA